jgi:hypothetical protein
MRFGLLRNFKKNCGTWAALLLSLMAPARGAAAELQSKTLAAWETYIRFTEQRIDREIADPGKFLAIDFQPDAPAARERMRAGQLEIHRMTTTRESGREIEVDNGLIHHWVGAAFIPGVHLGAVIDWVRDYDHLTGRFPEIIESKLLSRQGDTFQFFFKLRRKKIITVYYDSYYTATYRNLDPHRVVSSSYATKIAQLDNPDTPREREMPVGRDSGYLWRLNSYWRFQEADGGVYVECESVSLSRDVPFGFGWMLSTYAESVPRESLENTLTSIRDGVLKDRAGM